MLESRDAGSAWSGHCRQLLWPRADDPHQREPGSELPLRPGGFDAAAVAVAGGILGRGAAAAVKAEGSPRCVWGITPGAEGGHGAVGVGERRVQGCGCGADEAGVYAGARGGSGDSYPGRAAGEGDAVNARGSGNFVPGRGRIRGGDNSHAPHR